MMCATFQETEYDFNQYETVNDEKGINVGGLS